ncbi:hypothetical protein POM88_019624 [Heracleum sosnowskyi]|uniref:F-box associated beta-propeller type 3 domain-containing protein n=1 Tax=Heracleum sosnowskyi TaxID=360622 RepID=A0AAD8MRB0_9APIA|nr:hypothetical protein POM88_019624 [Heracleum sosnowskyi]
MRREGNSNPNNSEWTIIICCMNGLVLLQDRHKVFGMVRFVIWNPATKKCLKIPRPSNADDFEGHNNHFSGFGFDSVANDVKIMHGTAIAKQRLVGYIYSCNDGCWRRITPSNFLFRGHIVNYLNPVIAQGSPFWLCYRYCRKTERLVVMSFDVQRESFMLLPIIGDSTGYIPYSTLNEYTLMNFRDSIAVMYWSTKVNFFRGTIWICVFNERSDDWSKMSIGPLKPEENLRYGKPDWEKPGFVQCFRNGDILFGGSAELYYVDLQNHTIKNLGKKEDLNYDVVHGYTESSFFIDGMQPFYDKENEVQFFFLRKTGEDIQKLWHSSASLRSARQEEIQQYLCMRDKGAGGLG